ncbi:hypothetical protein M422DRAFT_71771 [Sphaerobolus stellatus SS14]|uniref:Xrn1 helical domain-containing protein n=1 Tax=Sphaerobolus stellatus (strain SS14) TaxID=990650 RepID=A0A0C9UCX5_SPHS4|nr:hypothetical protein M422DRAFT_71771 [Sphaerobolus stellatus SS14]
MALHHKGLSEDERRRNKWGSNVLFVSNEHTLHPLLSALYTKRKPKEPVQLDLRLSKGIAGSVLPDPQCIPDSTYFSPFVQVDLPDIPDNRSISALYYYPRQLKPHRSEILRGIKRSPRVLTTSDYETLHRRGGRGRGRGDGGPGRGGGGRGMYGGGNSYGGGPPGGYDRERGGYGYGYASPYGPPSGGGAGSYGAGRGGGYGPNYGGGPPYQSQNQGGRDYGNYGSNPGYGNSGYGSRGRGRGR